MKPEQLTEALKTTFGENLKSVVLYGSSAAGDHTGKRSDYNVLAVLNRLGAEELEVFSKTARRWVKAGNPPPLLMTPGWLTASADVFPIEFADIRQAHRILYGEDLVSGIRISQADLRLELERQLKERLLQLRESYLLRAAGSGREIRDLLIRSLSTFLVLFRAALRLWEPEVPPKKMEAARRLARHVPFDVEVFDQLGRAKATGRLQEQPRALMVRVLAAVERVSEAVDQKLRQGEQPQ